jgi:hypothetical protein
MIGIKGPITSYAAMPTAIPTAKWVVVPMRGENPVRDHDGWMVVAEFDSFEAADAEAAKLTRILSIIVQ